MTDFNAGGFLFVQGYGIFFAYMFFVFLTGLLRLFKNKRT